MPKNTVQAMIRETFLDMAQALETGKLGGSPRMALTGLGSELGEDNAFQGALMAAREGVDVTYIGTLKDESLHHVPAASEEEARQAMEKLLKDRAIDGAVTMHYPFPIGVATVGRAVIPANGKEMFIATTTGTASPDRVQGMVLGAIYGVITAKACGVKNPTVGILNIDGGRQTELALNKLISQGYPMAMACSLRSDGGCVMRGNDVLSGTPDVMVMDSLTGNLVIKMLSSFASSGQYESLGYGYNPDISEDYEQLVLIASRASGARVIANALKFGSTLVQNDYRAIAAQEFALANKAGLKEILADCVSSRKGTSASDEPAAPPRESVTADIAGIDVMDLESATHLLWREGIYAESGMGCTGPIVLVSDSNLNKSAELLKKGGFIG